MPTPVHDWVKLRLDALIAEGVTSGMEREVIIAVLTDLVEGPDYNAMETTEADQLKPDGRTDPEREPLADKALPITREGWFPYSVSTLPDQE